MTFPVSSQEAWGCCRDIAGFGIRNIIGGICRFTAILCLHHRADPLVGIQRLFELSNMHVGKRSIVDSTHGASHMISAILESAHFKVIPNSLSTLGRNMLINIDLRRGAEIPVPHVPFISTHVPTQCKRFSGLSH